MTGKLFLCLAAISAPTLTAAQDISFSGAATLGLGFHDLSDISQDIRTNSLEGRLDFTFESGFTFGVDAGHVGVKIDDVPFDLSADFVGLRGGYGFASGMSLGLYHEQLNAGADILPIDISLKSTGVTAGYQMEGLEFGAFVGQSKTSPSLSPDIDFEDFGFTAKYSAVAGLTLGAAFLRTTIDTPGIDIDLDFAGLAASYSVSDQISVFGGVSKTSLDLIEADATTMGLGLGYALPEMGGVNSTVSLELARTDLSVLGTDVGNMDTIRLGLTIPLGSKGTEAPLNSVADSVFNPRHSAINAGLTSAF
ncbi:porin [Tabrizicola caldifontis]|uniref:porin n=1 Tax=Tabrizicola caldifontis TaxID=2528036 RepID=UPI001080BFF6|nr:porin [Rhodobacter sp. YIM 73028]